jgi:pimeloyl-[acyl-carrier protein] methyl ester esterase
MSAAPLLFVHGWAMAPAFWEPLAERLADFERHFIDLGFYGEPASPTPKRPLVVAHSMGLPWALAHIPRPWAGVVAINAFGRFVRAQHFIEGTAPRMLERMINRFAEAPQQVAEDFLTRCGLDSPQAAGLEPERTGEALAWLGRCDERTAYRMLTCPRRALAGLADPIVPREMSLASFPPDELILADGAGHLLPLTHPDWVAANIREIAAMDGS